MKKKLGFLFVLACLSSPYAHAQVANGDFSGGGTNWNWSEAVFEQILFVSCDNANYSVYSPSLGQDTPSIGTSPASGRVAMATPFPPYATGTWIMCRKIDQTVIVPQGASLSFAYQIGVVENTSRILNSATLRVYVTDLATNQTVSVFTTTGTSRKYPCVGGIGGAGCPKFTNKSVDLSPYWGKTIKLTFRGVSSLTNNSSMSSPIYIDNVVIQ